MNRKCRLTDRVVADSRPASREYTVRDSVLSGFTLRVRPSGVKSWVMRGRTGDPSAKTTLGSATEMSADDARARAHAYRAGNVEAALAKKPTTLKFRAFAALYRQRSGSKWKASTLRTFDSYLRSTLLPTFATKRLEEITPVQVATWFHTYSRTAPGGANRTLAILKSMLNAAVDWGMLPGEGRRLHGGIRKNRRPPRGRLLNHDQIRRLGDALRESELKYPDDVDAIRLVLLTGCRSGEIRRLRWSEVLKDRIELSDAKTGPRTVHLGSAARELLAGRQTIHGSPFVFQSKRKANCPRAGLAITWAKIRTLASLPGDIRLHDLRHTFASHAVMGGESMIVTGGLLGHRQAASTARYAHLFDDYLLSVAGNVSGSISNWISSLNDCR
jgi:integrase